MRTDSFVIFTVYSASLRFEDISRYTGDEDYHL